LTVIYTKSFVGWGFAPDPTGEAYSAPPDPLAVFRGSTSKEKGERERMGGKRRGGEGWSLSFALGRKKEKSAPMQLRTCRRPV